MPVPLIVLTNGRPECVTKAISSVGKHLLGVGDGLIVDDSGDDVYRAWLTEQYAAPVIPVGDGPCGYWRAMQKVWDVARGLDTDKVVFWEEDFVLTGDVNVEGLADVLDTHPYLTQIALKRQPWFHNEVEAGGLIEALEAQGQTFTECTDGAHWWVEHRACFTGNPCLMPRSTVARDWPEGDWSESRFGKGLFADGRARGAYWGRLTDPPRVEHIGHQRVGTEY